MIDYKGTLNIIRNRNRIFSSLFDCNIFLLFYLFVCFFVCFFVVVVWVYLIQWSITHHSINCYLHNHRRFGCNNRSTAENPVERAPIRTKQRTWNQTFCCCFFWVFLEFFFFIIIIIYLFILFCFYNQNKTSAWWKVSAHAHSQTAVNFLDVI
jgi:hypothetical protein